MNIDNFNNETQKLFKRPYRLSRKVKKANKKLMFRDYYLSEKEHRISFSYIDFTLCVFDKKGIKIAKGIACMTNKTNRINMTQSPNPSIWNI
jgi:hypothetical protein|tara:strand:+ start:1946 stop:2221 length:276 start_codon:yes stop_codon:yes gene_type:complete